MISMGRDFHRTRKFGLVVKFYAKAPINIQKLIKIILIEIFKNSVFFLFESGSLDSPGGARAIEAF